MKEQKIFLVLLLSLLLSNVFIIYSQDMVKLYNDKKGSTITYYMSHPLHDWSGVSKNVTCILVTDANKENFSQVAVSVKVSTFDSDNSNRDSHMMEATEAIKFPTVTFQSTSIKKDGNKLYITGKLTFHGVTKTISFDATMSRNGDKLIFKGDLQTKMSYHKIDSPSLMGMDTKDDIKLVFNIEF